MLVCLCPLFNVAARLLRESPFILNAMPKAHLLPLLRIILSLAALLLIKSTAQGQVVLYRNADSPKLWTVAAVDSSVQLMNTRGKAAGYEFHAKIKKTITRPDTIIHEYSLTGTKTSAAQLARQQELLALVGKPLPAFQLSDLQGKSVSSTSFLGKPMVLNLWFTSCGPCLAEMPWLNRIQRAKAHTDVVFLAVTFESREKVQAFLRKQPFSFRHLVGAKEYCKQFTSGYPTSFFVDRKGIVRQVLGEIPVNYDKQTNRPIGANDQEFYKALQQIEVTTAQ